MIVQHKGVAYDITVHEQSRWIMARTPAHKFPVGFAANTEDAIADLNHWLYQRRYWMFG